MSEEKSVEAILDEAAEARAEEAGVTKAKAENEGEAAKPESGGDDAAEKLETTEGEEAPESGDEPEEGEEKPKKESRAQKRIRQLTRERDQERRAREEREAELRLLVRQREAETQSGKAKPEPQQDDDAQPNQDDYEGDYAKFIADTAAWAGRQAAKGALELERKANAEHQAKSRQQQQLAAMEERAKGMFAEGAKAYDDFDEVAGADFPVTDAMSSAILDSEKPHEVMYHLGQNPEEAERISKLGPVAQIREVTKLEAKLAKPVAKKATSASEPIKPVGGKGSSRQFNPDECSMDEYMRDYHKRRVAGDL